MSLLFILVDFVNTLPFFVSCFAAFCQRVLSLSSHVAGPFGERGRPVRELGTAGSAARFRPSLGSGFALKIFDID